MVRSIKSIRNLRKLNNIILPNESLDFKCGFADLLQVINI